jgi:small subunit ribosomal protein S18
MPRKGRGGKRRKVCQFCVDKINQADYKDVNRLTKFLTDRGKILPRRISGNCARHQRQVTIAVKRARQIALMAYTTE